MNELPMPEFTINGVQVVDRVPMSTNNEFNNRVFVPESWESKHVKVIEQGENGSQISIKGEEVISRTFPKRSNVAVSIPEHWSSDSLKIVRTGERLSLATADTFIESTEQPDDRLTDTLQDTSPSEVVRDAIKHINKNTAHTKGVPVSEVVVETADILTETKCRDTIQKLVKKGEVYKPQTGHVKTT